MEINDELGAKIQELQIIERNMQSIQMEMQTLQVELNGANNAIDELKKSNDEAYKILNGLMIRSSKDFLIKELSEKKKVFELKINAMEKQEKSIEEKASKLRADINASFVEKK